MSRSFTARIIVLNSKNQVLLQQKSQTSKNAAGMWELPGGKIAYTEEEKRERIAQGLSLKRNSRDAVIDELHEEKNIDLKPLLDKHPHLLKFLGELEYEFFDAKNNQTTQRVGDLYCITVPQEYLGNISKTGLAEDNLEEYGWFGLEEIVAMEGKISENSRFYKKFDIF